MPSPETTQGAERKSEQPSAASLQIIWFALLASVGTYALIGTLIKPSSATSSVSGEQLSLFLMVFAALAVAQTGFAMLAPRILSQLPTASLQILRWALAESISIFGLILHFLGGRPSWFYIFLAWSALLLLTLRPGPEIER